MQKNFYWITIKCNKSSLQIRYFASLLRGKASERRHARSAINTTQAERSVVLAMRTSYRHLEEMRQTKQDVRGSVMSHISDMLVRA